MDNSNDFVEYLVQKYPKRNKAVERKLNSLKKIRHCLKLYIYIKTIPL